MTLADNQAKRGGGIFNSADTTTLRNVTVSGNSASSEGGGVWSDKNISFDHVTVAYNTAPVGKGGGVFEKAQEVTIGSSLFVGNTGGNTNTALTSQGYNLSDDASARIQRHGLTKRMSPPARARLAANGGFTRTVAIGAGSAARDAANPASRPDRRSARHADLRRAQRHRCLRIQPVRVCAVDQRAGGPDDQ